MSGPRQAGEKNGGPPRSPIGIRTRLMLSHLAVIVVAMGLSGFLLLSLLERYFLQAMEESLLAQAEITAQALAPGVLAGAEAQAVPSAAFNALQQQASNYSLQAENVAPAGEASPQGAADLGYLSNSTLQISSALDTRIRILDAAGMVVADSAQSGRGTSLADDPAVTEALAGRQSSRVEGTGSDALMALALPWEAGGQQIGVVYLSQPLRDVTAVLHDLRLRWLAATLLALLLSAATAILLSGAIARPLRRLTEAAGEVAGGNLDLRVPVEGRDELGQLSTAFNDMTGRLRSTRQAQVDLVANVSHELRTPLTTVKGMVETLRDGAVEDVETRDRFLASVEGEADRMIGLVNDLLLLSRADSGALDLRQAAVDLGAAAARTLDRLRPLAEKKQVALQLDSSEEPLAVWADESRLERVLVNLLDNAVKYSRPGGRVTVSLRRLPGKVAEVQVRDEGLGIPAEALPRIGERFFRGDRARSREEGGSGLGLAIARALVEAQGGRLSLDSREGQGTTATFTLPPG
ncbi:MAG TPA: ATP-binding protein [Anaerolineae bacterium]|nr:ATP-binding protein [Anaerolineae bacterium]